jgi:hypothetical protein
MKHEPKGAKYPTVIYARTSNDKRSADLPADQICRQYR